MTNTLLEMATEKGIFSSFRQHDMSFRPAMIGNHLIDLSPVQLPTTSVLHVIDQLLAAKVTDILPDLTNPLIANEAYPVYLDNVLTIPGKDAVFPITDIYRFRPFAFNQQIRSFWTDHKTIHRMTSLSQVLSRTMALPVVNYNALLTTQVFGTFVYYRKFALILRTILNHIVAISGKHQFLQIPLSRTIYNRVAFTQTADQITYLTVRIKNDPSFYFMIHLLNFLSKTATTSLFSSLTPLQCDQLNIVLTAGNKAIIYNLGDLKAIKDARHDNTLFQMVLRHITTLKLAGYAQTDISHLDDAGYDALVQDLAVAPPTEDVTEPSTVAPPSSVQPLKETSPLSTTPHSSAPEPVKHTTRLIDQTSANPAVAMPNTFGGTRENQPLPTPIIKHTIAIPPSTAVVYNPHEPIMVIDHTAYQTITANTHLSEAQKERCLRIAQAYKSCIIDGQSIEVLLSQTAEPTVATGHLPFLEGKLPDPSMLQSRGVDFDRHYLDHTMSRDIAAVVAHLTGQGMMLVETSQKDNVTELDRIRHYTLVFEDLTGRRHRMSFKLPIVSHDGTIRINGIESRMIKQQVNLPICKIDPWRVSLASNYNKTIVERIRVKAHNYAAYITKYLAQVYKAHIGLTVNYGNFDPGAIKLPYDYTGIAQRYSRLRFGDYDLTFDYPNRLAHGATENQTLLSTEGIQTASPMSARLVAEAEKTYGIYIGTQNIHSSNRSLTWFFGYDNFLRAVDQTGRIEHTTTFADLIFAAFGDQVSPPKPLSEWTELKILDANFPIVFLLGFEYGLKHVLDHLKLVYTLYPKGQQFERTATTLAVPFADVTLVFDRYPLTKSFIAAGLLKFDLRDYPISLFDTPNGYYTLLADNRFSMNYLKGITNFFQLFIDPITRDVLLRMGEPTDVAGLLLRATQMLTTDDAIPTASMENHRLRGYERFATTLYNEMTRTYAAFSHQRGNRKTFSINPESVFLRLVQDQTLRIVDEINPVENVKDKHSVTYTGSGGRTAQSFVIEDRRYPADAVGIISECTPDSGKVAINVYTTADPAISNVRGMFTTTTHTKETVEPAKVLAITTLLMPCATNDDAKRSNYLSIQLKHHVPSEYSETMRIRTGYEMVLAHRTGENYACTAKRDGVVDAIDATLGLIRLRYHRNKIPVLDVVHLLPYAEARHQFQIYAHQNASVNHAVYMLCDQSQVEHLTLNTLYQFQDVNLKVTDLIPLTKETPLPPGLPPAIAALQTKILHPILVRFLPVAHNATDDVDIFQFGTKFTSVSGSFLEQTLVVNVAVGDVVHLGDVIAYNSGFFERDPLDTKQVTWKHGVMGRIALMEGNDTIEDSNAITQAFSQKLMMKPAHMRILQITKATIVKDLKPVGSDVQTTDLLCTLEDAEIGLLTDSDDRSMLDLLNDLNRKAPRAKYHGCIAKIDVLHACPIQQMHPSLAAIVEHIDAYKRALSHAAAGTPKASSYAEPSLISVGTKYHGVEFAEDTVILIFYITEEIDHDTGDKLVVGNAAKSITATVIDNPISTESGYPIDMLFSARSISNRIILSPTLTGTTNRCLETLEYVVLKMYFE